MYLNLIHGLMLIDKVLKLSNNFNIVYFSIFNYLSIFNIILESG